MPQAVSRDLDPSPPFLSAQPSPLPSDSPFLKEGVQSSVSCFQATGWGGFRVCWAAGPTWCLAPISHRPWYAPSIGGSGHRAPP